MSLMRPHADFCLQLEGGQLVTVPTNIIKRQKQHFHSLEQLGEQ